MKEEMKLEIFLVFLKLKIPGKGSSYPSKNLIIEEIVNPPKYMCDFQIRNERRKMIEEPEDGGGGKRK